MSSETDPTDSIKYLTRIKKDFDETVRQLTKFRQYQESLDVPTVEIKELGDFTKKYDVRYKLWNNLKTFREKSSMWLTKPFRDLDANEIVAQVKDFDKDNLMLRQQLPRDQADQVLEALKAEVKEFGHHNNLVLALGNKALEQKHWDKIFGLIGQPTPALNAFNLKTLLDFKIDLEFEKVDEISAFASGEATINGQLKEIAGFWESQALFFVLPYRDSKDRFIIGDIEDTIAQLEDNQMSIQTMMGSKYVAEIRGAVELWEKHLGYITDVIDEWLTFQRQWMYLENIFNAEDIQKQLPAEAKLFQGVDKWWKDHMKLYKAYPQIYNVTKNPTLLTRFQASNKTLEDIQKSLEDYLETKRAAFPRFYFLSNDELLEILSQTRNVQAVQPHLRKCFDSILKIEFAPAKGSKDITGMFSAELEFVPFSAIVKAEGNVEFWLRDIERMMIKTLYDITKRSLEEYPTNGIERNEWLFNYPAQPVITIDQVMWTTGVTAAITEIMRGKNRKALEEFLDFSIKQINKMVDLVRGDLNSHQRTLMGALIVIDVHAREVVRNMIKSRVETMNDFEWMKQLRYYWEQETEEDDDCFTRQTNTRFRYGYEYLGNGPRLVITPLTDKCYMTLTGALHMNYGGAPAGPAGTGKTETTKDLAKALAI